MAELGTQSAAMVKIRRRPPGYPPPAELTPLLRHCRGTKAARARTWLVDYLTARGGSCESAALKREAATEGFSPETLRMASSGRVRIDPFIGGGHRTAWTLIDQGDETPSRPTLIVTARAWLTAYLAAREGHAPCSEIKAAAERDGHHPRAIDKARVALGVVSRTIPGFVPRRTEWILASVAQDIPPSTTRGAASAWMIDFLSRSGGSAESSLLKDVGLQFGFNARTLQRARHYAGVSIRNVPESFPRRTVWVLDAPAPIESVDPDLSAWAIDPA